MAPLQLYLSFYSSLFRSMWTLAFARLYRPQNLSKRDLTGRIAIITGANSGIGLSIATHLARQGAKAIDEIVSKIGDKSRDRLHCWNLDTSDLSSVRAFCGRWEREGSHEIDMLVHNAGIASIPANSSPTTPDGNDLILTTNFLGSFLMTRLLLPHLTSAARVVLTSSTGHYAAADLLQSQQAQHAPGFFARLGAFISTKLNLPTPSSPTYTHSKALQVLFAYLLQMHFNRDPHASRSAHAFLPGFTYTLIFGKLDMSWRLWVADPFFALLRVAERYVAVDADQGARTGSWLAAEGTKEGGGSVWEWGIKRTSLVDMMRGTLGENEWQRRAGEEWRAWERKTGVKWELGIEDVKSR
ncbi:hypothetical protein DE146DRAFT_680939 [Phaeosphaeria sp. MPI-PUGE-AT-0046c]|nr:hypothetical protein DE146DRAFT_680939 [Phaeosphaeria sp. MPI-PUGE-AT-0046c]